jgi:hypothetical protein
MAGLNFRESDVRPAGYVFRLPPGPLRGTDKKNRRHFLMNRCPPEAVGTVAYMTSKEHERKLYQAPCHEILMHGRRVRRERDHEGSFVYPCQLLFRRGRDLVRAVESEVRQVRAVRTQLKEALGIGSGLPDPSLYPDSLRGRLVRLAEPLASQVASPYAFVLTQHAYSQKMRFQVVVSVLPEDLPVSDPDLRVEGDYDWMRFIGADGTAVILTRFLFSAAQEVRNKDSVRREFENITSFALSREILEELDES